MQPPDDRTGFVDLPTYILTITAHISSVPRGLSFLRQSPSAMLDLFVGYPGDHDAPQWMRWATSSIFFTDKTASFARVFKEIAVWKVNSDKVS
jgi:hypothetical protein